MQKPNIGKNKNIYWVVGLLIINQKINAKKLAKKLIKKGVQTRPFFYPMNKQKILKKYIKRKKENFPNSDFISKYGLYLPSYYSLTKKDIQYICDQVKSII